MPFREPDPLSVEPPILHTVEEAAGLLRIGRTLAYALARRYEDSDGRDGLPVVRLGKCLRGPRWALIELATHGRVVPLSDLETVVPSNDDDDDAVNSTARALRLVDARDEQDDGTRRYSTVEQLALRFPQD